MCENAKMRKLRNDACHAGLASSGAAVCISVEGDTEEPHCDDDAGEQDACESRMCIKECAGSGDAAGEDVSGQHRSSSRRKREDCMSGFNPDEKKKAIRSGEDCGRVKIAIG